MKTNRFLYFIPLLVTLVLVGIFARALFTHNDYIPSPLEHKPLPRFALPMLEDKDAVFSNDLFKGKYVLLNIFASWCVSCRIEHPYLMALGKEIPIYGIAWKDKAENTRHWLKQHGNPYVAVGLDIQGTTILDLGVTGAPETFLISPEGKVLFRYPGPLSEEVVKERIMSVINE